MEKENDHNVYGMTNRKWKIDKLPLDKPINSGISEILYQQFILCEPKIHGAKDFKNLYFGLYEDYETSYSFKCHEALLDYVITLQTSEISNSFSMKAIAGKHNVDLEHMKKCWTTLEQHIEYKSLPER